MNILKSVILFRFLISIFLIGNFEASFAENSELYSLYQLFPKLSEENLKISTYFKENVLFITNNSRSNVRNANGIILPFMPKVTKDNQKLPDTYVVYKLDGQTVDAFLLDNEKNAKTPIPNQFIKTCIQSVVNNDQNSSKKTKTSKFNSEEKNLNCHKCQGDLTKVCNIVKKNYASTIATCSKLLVHKFEMNASMPSLNLYELDLISFKDECLPQTAASILITENGNADSPRVFCLQFDKSKKCSAKFRTIVASSKGMKEDIQIDNFFNNLHDLLAKSKNKNSDQQSHIEDIQKQNTTPEEHTVR